MEQDRRQPLAHVVLDVVGQHAQEDVRTDTILAHVMDGPYLQIETLHGAEGALDGGQILIGGDRLVCR